MIGDARDCSLLMAWGEHMLRPDEEAELDIECFVAGPGGEAVLHLHKYGA